jgi:hypothetical protein
MNCYICDETKVVIPCPWCGQPVCQKCRQDGAHFDEDHSHYAVGFCPPCMAIMPLKVVTLPSGDEGYECVACGFDWSPCPLISDTKPGAVICHFCGFYQWSAEPLPYRCRRCGMEMSEGQASGGALGGSTPPL